MMKKLAYILLFTTCFSFAQGGYTKKVLESVEIETLYSYYSQNGDHAAVGGGIGTEHLSDHTPTIAIHIPVNDNAQLTVESGISAYSSASSGNINPFYSVFSYSNTGGGKHDDDDDKSVLANKSTGISTYSAASTGSYSSNTIGTPWYASSGASNSDVLAYVALNYSQSSEDRNTVINTNFYGSNEYDYTSIGLGLGYTKLFNEKNTEVGVKAKAYIDKWRPIYPTELHEYHLYGSSFLSSGYFAGQNIYNASGTITTSYHPSNFQVWDNSNRNSYTFSMSFSQILSKRVQMLLDTEFTYQQGLLSTPYHRIYFKDTGEYYLGNYAYISVYESSANRAVFRLADDVERMPATRYKIPIGMRLNAYINDYIQLRTFWRYYFDNWGVDSKTAAIELPLRLSSEITFTPMYRFYTQSAADYFKPYNQHVSTEQYYTSDYDLSAFDARQYGFGFSYKDIFTTHQILNFGLKNVDIRYQRYKRSDGLNANIIALGFKFVEN